MPIAAKDGPRHRSKADYRDFSWTTEINHTHLTSSDASNVHGYPRQARMRTIYAAYRHIGARQRFPGRGQIVSFDLGDLDMSQGKPIAESITELFGSFDSGLLTSDNLYP